MPWVYRITDVKTIGAGTYVKVNIWRTKAAAARGDPPNIINEHIMNLKSVRQRNVTNKDGYTLRESGVYASPRAPADPTDPPVKENVDVDVRGEIEGNIKRFIDRAIQTGLPDLDMSEPAWVPDNTDPRGILARPDVQAVKNKNIDYSPTLAVTP